MSAVNVMLDRRLGVDPVTRGLTIAITYLPGFGGLDVNFWSQVLSFASVGIIVFSSIRGLLIHIMKFFHFVVSFVSARAAASMSSDQKHGTSASASLFLAQLMGTYFLSSVVLLRANLPEQFRGTVTAALGDLSFNFYHRWFDILFIPSAILSALAITLVHKSSDKMRLSGEGAGDSALPR
jgi:golgi pH regulator